MKISISLKQQQQQQSNDEINHKFENSDISINHKRNNENNITDRESGQRRRRKRRKGHLKKHEVSNCGTKEPKQASETHIEWLPQGKVIVQNSHKIRNRIRKKFYRHRERQRQQRQRRKRQRLHRAKKLEQMLNHRKDLRYDEAEDFDDFHVKSRNKRSVSTPRHVEALVVADSSMVEFHQDGDVEMYLLTIMNMVSSLYKDPAIGNLIKVVVVRIVLLEEEESHPDFNVTQAAERNLQNFCRWQRLENPKDDSDPNHHDVAILITRKNICSAEGCE